MSGMNQFLAEAYGTAAPQVEDAEKVAQAELFAKLAAENNIDLSQLSDAQIQELWDATFSNGAVKTAEHGHKDKHGHDGDDGDKKVAEAALAEWAATKEAQAKMAEADFLGRQMAHAYVQELRKIANEGPVPDHKAMVPRPSIGKKVLEHLKSHKGKYIAGGSTAAAAGALGGGYALYKKHKNKKKQASALTQLAFTKALEKAAEAGYDPEEVAERVNAVLTLGLFDETQTKVAAATQFPDAVEVRALELLETAGYPITWNEG